VGGIIMDVKVSSGSITRREAFAVRPPSSGEANPSEEEYKTQIDKLREGLTEALSNILLGEKIPLDVVNGAVRRNHHPGQPQDHEDPAASSLAAVSEHVEIDPSPVRIKIMEIIGSYSDRISTNSSHDRERKIGAARSWRRLGDGAIKQVKVYVATKQ